RSSSCCGCSASCTKLSLKRLGCRDLRQPPHPNHLRASCRLYTLLRLAEGLDFDCHVVSVGVNEIGGARHDADMAFPKHEIAAAKFRALIPVYGLPEFFCLHVGIARRIIARGFEGELHEARAVEPDAGAAAPKIRRAQKFLCHGDGISYSLARWQRVAREDIASILQREEFTLVGFGGDKRIQAEQGKRRRLGVWLRKYIGAERGDPMSRLDDGGAQTLAGHIADIEIAIDLHPSPALALGKSGDGLTLESLGLEERVGARIASQGKRRRHNLARLALHVALGLDQVPEPRVGKARAISVSAWIGKTA